MLFNIDAVVVASAAVGVIEAAIDASVAGNAFAVVGISNDGVAADADDSICADVGCCKLSIMFLLASALFILIGLLLVRARSGLISRARNVARICERKRL